MSWFMQIKSLNPNLRQDQLVKELCCSTSTSQRYRNDKNMLSPHRIQSNSYKKDKRFQLQTSMIIHIVRVTSKDLK